jgi:hypothetical protein
MGLFDIFSTKPAEDAAAAQIAGLNAGYNQASDLINSGLNKATTNFNNAASPFQQLYNTGLGGANAYADATGANGAAGYDRAVKNFRADPGYQFALDQGNENILRKQASTGQLASGNTNLDLLRYGQGLADQQYGGYVSRLAPFLGAAQGAAQGNASVLTGLGQLQNQDALTQGQLAYNTQAGIGNAHANADLAAYNASANALNAILGAGKLAAKMLGAGSVGL